MQGEMVFADVQQLLHEEEEEEGGEQEQKEEEEKDAEIDVPVLDIEMLSSQSNLTSQSDDNYEPASKKLICEGATCALKRKKDLAQWEKDIEKGGTNWNKYATIDKWTFDRFIEARRHNEHVTTRILQQWAASAALQYTTDTDFKFSASLSWAKKFKQKHRIRQRHVTKYVSFKDTTTFEDTLEATDLFQKQMTPLISAFDPDYVINTDQTGCEYRMNIRRTLSYRG
ncbi:tigger transposable element-derived protein 6-like protein [Lasius niger]|uniref:Tigger transposable element-derived protein 6-like protein n=1 Tax=Lasius niger TaxID=67767 RepID=A0A0J7N252_LASNI|nr:tigger transposable element-derived protein 6-like protein [Lasius niger]